MGVTLEYLSKKELPGKAIFNNRMVIELCELVHFHHRNLRIVQTLDDFMAMADGFISSVDRWKKRGCPGTGSNQHIELCRKKVATVDGSNTVQINLNNNLYKKNKDGIFSEGSDFTDEDVYLHIKIRDLRLEFSITEFRIIAEAIKEAQEKLNAKE